MEIIDILNKIANDEQPPKKIIFRDDIYEYDDEKGDYYNNNFDALFDYDYDKITNILNEEVQILETTITYKPDKIEKLENVEDFKFAKLIDKINEIIEVLNER